MKNAGTQAPVTEGARAAVGTLMLGSLPAPVLSRIRTLIKNTNDKKCQGDRQLLLKYHAKRGKKIQRRLTRIDQ